MRLFKSDWVERVLLALKVPDDVPIENKSVTKSIAVRAGRRSRRMNFESRKNVLKYDDVMSRQREVIYGERREVLEGADLHEQVRTMIDETVATYVTAATESFPEEWDLDALWTALQTIYPISLRYQDLEREAGGRDGLDRDTLLDDLQADAQKAYEAREAEVGSEVMRELERQVMLSVLDRKWREHLYEMDYLREGIGLRAYSQRDPLVEYQREGFDMFNAMKEGIREETVGFLFNLEVQVEDEEEEEEIEDDVVPANAGHRHPRRGPGRPPRRRRSRPRAAHPGQGPAGAEGAAEPDLHRAQRGRRGRGQGSDRRPTPTTPTPGSAATRSARAARARSTRSATAPRAARRASPPALRGRLGLREAASAELQGGAAPAALDQLDPGREGAGALAVADVDADLGGLRRDGQNTCTLRTWLRSRRTRRSPGVVRASSAARRCRSA